MSPKAKPNYYEILGVLRNATQDEIKRAYFQAASRLHPDKNTAQGETELFLEAQQAFETLSNPTRRSQYDSTLPPEEKIQQAVEYTVHYSRPSLVNINEPQLIYAYLEITPPPNKGEFPAPPLNLCLVVDRSTSMKGNKMDLVKSSIENIIRLLRPEDVFSVVAFSDRADVIIPPSRILEPAKASALLRKIDPSGGTEIFQGLQAGFDQIQSNYSPAHVNHIVLLTDGHTYGDDRDCVAIAEKAALRNIGITCMGLGSDWNDVLLDTIATATGNSSAYIAQPTDIQKMLVRKFESLANIYSEDVQIDIRENNSVTLNYAFRISPDGSPLKDGSPIHLGPILHNQHLSILFEFKVEPSESKVDNAILLDGTLKLNMAARPTPLAPIRLLLTRDYVTEPVPQPPPDVLLNALSRVRLYRMQERARADLDEGRFDAATSLLQTLATHLLSQGERSLANTVLLEVDNLRKSQNMSSEGGKDIKYKTRALLLSAPQERK